jgi:NAD(P)-dependent dehydrogenase (short-subunit alcohol dehydrogenase family)
MRIQDNVFLVTGGGSGLGAATARRIAACGGKVVVADLVGDGAAAVAREIGAAARAVTANVVDADAVTEAVATAVREFGGLHGAINCAGIATGERVVGKNGPHGLASFERVIGVNLVGTFNVIRLAAAQMASQAPLPSGERGVLINTASVAAFDGQIGQAAYSASKAGIVGMTLPIARELARSGIRIMTIAPGIFDTPMLQGMSDEIRASLAAQVPFPARLGRPEEYAAMVTHIIESEMLNGEVIRLDGAIRMGAK